MAESKSLAERNFAQWPEDAAFAGTQEAQALEQRLYMQYLGVLTLFGGIVNRAELGDSEKARIDQAFVDANVLLKRRGSNFYYERCSGGGYAAFTR